MNALKTYKVANRKKYQVEYGFVRGQWNFRIGSFTLMTKVKGGREVADQIAEVLHKAWHRSQSIDGAARTTINKLLKVRTLKDFRPDAIWF